MSVEGTPYADLRYYELIFSTFQMRLAQGLCPFCGAELLQVSGNRIKVAGTGGTLGTELEFPTCNNCVKIPFREGQFIQDSHMWVFG